MMHLKYLTQCNNEIENDSRLLNCLGIIIHILFKLNYFPTYDTAIYSWCKRGLTFYFITSREFLQCESYLLKFNVKKRDEISLDSFVTAVLRTVRSDG